MPWGKLSYNINRTNLMSYKTLKTLGVYLETILWSIFEVTQDVKIGNCKQNVDDVEKLS